MTNPAATPARILIVDDDRHVRELVRRLLERAGYRCSTAENGEQARELLAAGTFDTVGFISKLAPEYPGKKFWLFDAAVDRLDALLVRPDRRRPRCTSSHCRSRGESRTPLAMRNIGPRRTEAPARSATGHGRKTVLTEATGQVEIDVPRDRDGTFEP